VNDARFIYFLFFRVPRPLALPLHLPFCFFFLPSFGSAAAFYFHVFG
jgi:hypothetical protein